MIIKELRIRNFGKIKDKTIIFDEGFNVVFGKNESGKTTIVTFIRFMLFGGQGRVNPVKEYFPLDMSEPSGEIVISHRDKEYLVVRNGAKKKGSYATVTNMSDGQVYTGEKGENLLSEIVGISEDMFASTIYLKDLSESTFLAKNEMLQRLENLSSSGDELVSFKKIIAELDEEKASLSKPARKDAIIPKLIRKSEELQAEIADMKTGISFKERLEANLREAEEKEKELTLMTENSDDESDEMMYKLNNDFSSLNNLIDETEKIIPYEYMSLTDKETDEIRNLEKSAKAHGYCIFAGVIVLFAVLSLILSFLPYLICSLSVVCVTGIFALYSSNKKRYRGVLSKYQVNSFDELCSKKEFFAKKEKELLSLKKKRDEISQNILILSKSKENKKNILAENMKRTVEAVTQKNRLQTEIERIGQIERELKEKEALYKEIKESLEKYSEYVKIIDDTKELISSAYEKMKKDFSPQVSEKAGKVFSLVTNNDDEKIVVSDDLNLSLKRGGEFYSVSNLSRSTLDLIYFSFRMAMIETVMQGRGCIIFDEAFIRYDKERLANVFSYLKDSSHQMIFTTFSEYEMEFAGNERDYNIIRL